MYKFFHQNKINLSFEERKCRTASVFNIKHPSVYLNIRKLKKIKKKISFLYPNCDILKIM